MKNLIPGVYIGNVEDKVSSSAIQNLKLTDGEQIIISPLINSEGKIITKTHYAAGIGSFYCFGGACCDKEDSARVYNHIPVLKYDCSKHDRNLVIDPNSEAWEVVNLKMYKDKMDTYLDLMATYGDLSNRNIKIVCNAAKYQDWTFIVLPDQDAAWKSIPGIASQLDEQKKFYFNNIIKSIAKALTEQEYLHLKKGVQNDPNAQFGNQAVNNGNLVNNNAVNNTPALQPPTQAPQQQAVNTAQPSVNTQIQPPAQSTQQANNASQQQGIPEVQVPNATTQQSNPPAKTPKQEAAAAEQNAAPKSQPKSENVSQGNNLDDVMASMFPDGDVDL